MVPSAIPNRNLLSSLVRWRNLEAKDEKKKIRNVKYCRSRRLTVKSGFNQRKAAGWTPRREGFPRTAIY